MALAGVSWSLDVYSGLHTGSDYGHDAVSVGDTEVT